MAKKLEDTAFGDVDTQAVGQQLGIATEYYSKVHNMIRYISRKGWDIPEGEKSVWTVDAEVGAWLDQGYRLLNTHFLGENPEGFGVMYILVRD